MTELLTYSSMREFRACPRRYYYRYIRGYIPTSSPWALQFGTIVHHALEAYWLGRKSWIKDPVELVERMFSKVPWKEIDLFEAVKIKLLLRAYHAVWGGLKCEVLAVESQFRFPLTKTSDFWACAGKLDVVIRLNDKRVVLIEHKSSGEEVGAGSDYRRRLTLDEQISFYWLGAESLGFKPNVVVYDVLVKPDEKPYKATPVELRKYTKATKTSPARIYASQREFDETPEEYEKRVEAAIIKEPDQHIQRIAVYRFNEERQKFVVNLHQQARLMQVSHEEKLFPQNSQSCIRFGTPCAFLGVCEGTDQIENPIHFKKGEVGARGIADITDYVLLGLSQVPCCCVR